MMFLSDKQIAERIGVSRQTIWRWVSQGDFPPPVKLGPSVTRWKTSAVDAWLAEREGAA
jgi:excisionase family DNA binding protein